MGLVHGDGVVFCGAGADLDRVAAELAMTSSLKALGELGGDATKGGAQALRCANRSIRRLPDGIALEADPRHAGMLAAMRGARPSR